MSHGSILSRSQRAPESGALWPSPDQELLLRAATLRGEPALAAWRAWTSRHDLIESHLDRGSFRLLPLVYKNLVAHGIDEPHLPRLKGIYRYWWCSNQDLLYQAAGLVEHLEATGIRTLVLKGAALSAVHYRDMGVRPMADVDVLVPFEQAHAASASLARIGWRPVKPCLEDEIRYRHSTPIVSRAGKEFDLHWHSLREGMRVDSDDRFWQRSVPLPILHARSRCLGATDALLHAVVHGMRWNEEPAIRWIADAMAILHSGHPIDWEALREEAQARRVQLRLARGLEYLRRAFDAPLPSTAGRLVGAVRPSPIERLEFRYLGARSNPENRKRALQMGPMIALEYLRVSSGRNLPRKITGLPGFLRYRLRGRHEPAVVVVRKVAHLLGLVPRRRGPQRPPIGPPALSSR